MVKDESTPRKGKQNAHSWKNWRNHEEWHHCLLLQFSTLVTEQMFQFYVPYWYFMRFAVDIGTVSAWSFTTLPCLALWEKWKPCRWVVAQWEQNRIKQTTYRSTPSRPGTNYSGFPLLLTLPLALRLGGIFMGGNLCLQWFTYA